jgi:hypothetical protein
MKSSIQPSVFYRSAYKLASYGIVVSMHLLLRNHDDFALATGVLTLGATGLSLTARGASYSLTDNLIGALFLQAFSWQAISDPAHGRVNYLSQSASISLNLTYTSNRL